jgi:hypothetical protein
LDIFIVTRFQHGTQDLHVSVPIDERHKHDSKTDGLHSTGATGYLGGDALYNLYNAHPEYEYSALVRSKEKAKPVTDAFPNVRIVIGGLDDSDILKEEASKADVVIRMNIS